MCVLSDEMMHDVNFVKKVINASVDYIKQLTVQWKSSVTFQMAAQSNTNAAKTFSIYLCTRPNIRLMLNGTFLPQAMVKTAVMG